MKVEQTRLEQAIEGMSSAFYWGSSDEGFEYWEKVIRNLERYRSPADSKAECRAKIAALEKQLQQLKSECC